MIVTSVGDEYLEVELSPKSDLAQIVRIAEACGGVLVQSVCKVCVSFVRGPLTRELCNEKLQVTPGAEPLDLFERYECPDCDPD